MEKIKVLIVEDKLMIAEDIASRLKRHSLEVIDICTSGEEAIQMAKGMRPDLILMDVELSGAIDGISAAQIILQEQSIPIIYLSDYTDSKTIERAKKTQPANYLAKPFNEDDLIRAIDIAFSNARHSPMKAVGSKDYVFLRTESQVYVKILYQDILCLEADRAYSSIITSNKTFKFSSSMSHIWEQLNNKDFIQVHRSYVVNINRITSLDGNVIRLGAHEVQMSKEFRDNLLSLVKIVK